jgi:signal transduction histidine kinase
MSAERLRFRDLRRISTFRLTLVLGALSLIGVVALLGLIYALTVRELTDRSDGILRDQAREWLALPPGDLPGRIADDLGARKLNYGALIARNGERVTGNILSVPVAPTGKPIDIDAGPTHGPLRLLAVTTANGETILVGRDISQIRDLRQRILVILLVSGLSISIGIALAAVALSLDPLRRVRDLQQSAEQIVGGRLEVRMPISGRHDELDQFATTVNLMVDEVARLIEQVKGVTDAIAHDLRTPLTRVRSQLHRARDATDSTSREALLAGAEESLEAALDRFAALLRISEIEAGARRAAFAPTELSQLLQDVVDLYEPLADERGMRLTLAVEPLPPIFADSQLLFEALGNLVDNAIKFAREAVVISAWRTEALLTIDIRDDGTGLDAAERGEVLARFHRGANAIGHPGSGLGLSIVAAILHLHRYELRLDDAEPGLRASILLPFEALPS